MNKCNSMFMEGVKRKTSIPLVLVVLIIFIWVKRTLPINIHHPPSKINIHHM